MKTDTRPVVRTEFVTRALVAALIVEHVMLVVSPLDVLSPIKPHALGRLVLHGHLPYRDFLFEYPPLAIVAFLLPGLVPSSLALTAMAVQALVLEVAVVAFVLRRHSGAVRRYALLSLLIFPFLSGGFDAYPMAAIAFSTALLAEGRATGWWVAAWGAATKLSPAAAWAWARRPAGAAAAALVVAVAVAVVPTTTARTQDSTYIGYTIHRGVEAESLAASTVWVAKTLTGHSLPIVYRFRSNEVRGAGGAADIWLVLAVAGIAALAWASGRLGHPDPWLASFVAVLLLLCASKVLSPQYVAWPAPLAAVLGGRWFRAWIAVAGLTALAYAVGHNNTAILAITFVRNVTLVATAATGLRALVVHDG